MPLRGPLNPDKLIKLIESELLKSDGPTFLAKTKWRDFCISSPNTTDPVEMAYAAFLHVSFDGSGHWNNNLHVLYLTRPIAEHRRTSGS